jgi:hypothetical protein
MVIPVDVALREWNFNARLAKPQRYFSGNIPVDGPVIFRLYPWIQKPARAYVARPEM